MKTKYKELTTNANRGGGCDLNMLTSDVRCKQISPNTKIISIFYLFIFSLRLHGYLFTNGICDIRFDKYIVKKTFVYILSKTLFSVKWQHQRKSTEIRTRRNMRFHDMLDLHVIVVVTELKIKNIKYQKIVILHELITNTHTHMHALILHTSNV